jgi:hypothetical protein
MSTKRCSRGVRAEVTRAPTVPCFEDDERRHDRERLDRLEERLGRGERAVAGLR